MLSDCSNVQNILRIYKADICQKVKNTEAEPKNTILIRKKNTIYIALIRFSAKRLTIKLA